MNEIHKLIMVIVFVTILPSVANAQNELGTWTSLEVEKKFQKVDIGAEAEFRTIYGLRLMDRWSLGANINYQPIKPIKIGFGYSLMNVLDEKYANYQFRSRLYASATGKLKLDRFSISLRERIQFTTKDASNRIKSDGTVDDYKINPALVWRNRLLVDYNIPDCKLSPSFSVESFYELNNPDGNQFDKFRFTLAVDYKINKSNSVSVFSVYNNKPTDDENSGKYILGIGYKFTIK